MKIHLKDYPGSAYYSDIFFDYGILHANWPAYPFGRGWETALEIIGMFPTEKNF